MNNGGSVTITFGATLPNINAMGWDTYADFRIRIERAVIDDHAMLKPTDPTLGWFVRNQWYRVLYYAVAAQNTAGALSAFNCTSSNCLSFNATQNIRALLVLAGRSLSNPAGRPNNILSDYIEYQNCDRVPPVTGPCSPDGSFEQRPMRSSKVQIAALNAPWNDRVILVDWNGSLNVPSQAVTLSPLRLATLP
jgi:hypothetical protein